MKTVLRVGIGPGEVEHELAPRMGLAKERHGTLRLAACILENQVLRCPAGPGRGAAAFFERQQEFMPQERLTGASRARAGRERIPARGIDLRDAGEKASARGGHAWTAIGLR